MHSTDIRVFIPSKDFAQSQQFYQALGFSKESVNDELCLFTQQESCGISPTYSLDAVLVRLHRLYRRLLTGGAVCLCYTFALTDAIFRPAKSKKPPADLLIRFTIDDFTEPLDSFWPM